MLEDMTNRCTDNHIENVSIDFGIYHDLQNIVSLYIAVIIPNDHTT